MQTLSSCHQIRYQRLLTHLAEELYCPNDVEKADRILHNILHTLRASLSFEASTRLLRLLPHALKPVFVENWSIAQHIQTSISADDFINQVRLRANPIAFYDFPTEADVEKTIAIVFSCLEKCLPAERKKQIRHIIPVTLRNFCNTCS